MAPVFERTHFRTAKPVPTFLLKLLRRQDSVPVRPTTGVAVMSCDAAWARSIC